MIKVLVHYKEWCESGNVHFDDTLEDKSKIVEVEDVLELNDMFKHITKLEVINNLFIPAVVHSKNSIIRKTQLDIMFRQWWKTDLTEIGITKEQVINVITENGSVYLIHWE